MDDLARWLAIIGAINWGLVGLLNINLVNVLVGGFPLVERIVYILVGIAGLWLVGTLFGREAGKAD